MFFSDPKDDIVLFVTKNSETRTNFIIIRKSFQNIHTVSTVVNGSNGYLFIAKLIDIKIFNNQQGIYFNVPNWLVNSFFLMTSVR